MPRPIRTADLGGGLWCRWSRQDQALKLRPVPAMCRPLCAAPPWRRMEHEAGRRLLAALLHDVAPRRGWSGLELAATGKPVLPGHPRIGVSISHSHPWVAVAVGRGCDVGVDIEAPAAGTAETDLWDWTIREACMKVTGAGLASRPSRMPIVGTTEGVSGLIRWRALRGESPVPLSLAWRPSARGEQGTEHDTGTVRQGWSAPEWSAQEWSA